MKVALSAAYLIGVLTIIWTVKSLPDTSPEMHASGTGVDAIPAPQTVVIRVDAVLSIPTAVPTEIPTMYPTSKARTDRVNVCGTATPGAVCEWPQPTPLPPTPLPACSVAVKGGQLCKWPTEPAT
jgi:hypothetical protein